MIRFATLFAAALMLAPPGVPQPPPATAPPANPFDPSEIEVGFAPAGFTLPDVDVELILMADVSSSMDATELRQQREGYVAALRSGEVAAAVAGGALGKVALAYAEFAGEKGQVLVVPWTVVEDRAGLEAFAAALAAQPPRSPRLDRMPASYGTSVGGAIAFGHAAIEANGLTGERAVIDVSGDGEDNSTGLKAGTARDLAVAAGLQVNGLPIVGDPTSAGLEGWYRANVIGGPGAFLVAVDGFANFAEAVRRKLVLEIAMAPAWPAPAGLRERAS